MTPHARRRQELIRQHLAPIEGADGHATAEIAAQTWRRVLSRIAPIIGEAGVRALYGRALHLTRAEFLVLTNDPLADWDRPPFEHLRPLLKERSATEVSEISAALLISFTELLATLIGDALTTQLTAPA